MHWNNIIRTISVRSFAVAALSFGLGATAFGATVPNKENDTMKSSTAAYLKPLQQWTKSLQGGLYFPPDRPEIGCCGLGDHGHWSMQTNTTTFAALAILATDPDLNEQAAGMSRVQLRDAALKLLRFTLRTHVAGTEKTLDGQAWGLSWISPLCLERMMHGIEALEEYLTASDRQALRQMLIAESDWQLDHNPVVGNIDAKTGKNKPESNIWSGCLLFRTAIMYPDAPRRKEYLEKANRFILNGISIPSDAASMDMIDGRPVRDWHVGPNYTANFALNHHGYLNVGYMVICLSNIAMLHFSCRSKGIEAPAALYRHVPELWRMIRLCTFDDGRLWRIGGDTRVRYCYCQDYVIPMWLMMRDKYGEDVAGLEKSWLKQIAVEQQGNADGSFYRQRLHELEEASPLYYHRLEGDRAAALSMGLYWSRKFPSTSAAVKTLSTGGWQDEFHGALVEKSPRRAASWVWLAAQRPTGMCLPAERSDLAEWRWNLVGEIIGMGTFNYADVTAHRDVKFPGGFSTAGRLNWRSDAHIAEGQADELTAQEDLAAFALPDDATMVVFQRVVTVNRTVLKSVKGVFYNVPNDLFNGNLRSYETDHRIESIQGVGAKTEILPLQNSVTVDGQLTVAGIYGIDTLSLYRPGKRQIMIFNNKNASFGRSGGNLYCDEICHPCITEHRQYPARAVLFDQAFAIGVNGKTGQAEALTTDHELLKAVRIKGADGKDYALAVNFASDTVAFNHHPVFGSRKLGPLETVILPLP